MAGLNAIISLRQSLDEREGLREYYDPRTGRGMGATDFAWSTLIWEMADPE